MDETKDLVKKITEGIQEKKGRNIVIADLTNIEDTICKEKMIKMAADIEKGATLLNYKSVAEDARDYINKFNNDDTFIVLYKLKVRIKGNEESYIKEYYAIDNKGVIVIQCYALMFNQLPEIYSNFLDDCNVMTMKLNLFMKVSNSFLGV